MIKVEHTKTHNTSIVEETYPNGTKKGIKSYAEILVAPAKLVLVETTKELCIGKYEGKTGKWFNPIFISETEKIEVGDLSACYDCTTNEFVGIGTVEEIYENNIAWCSDHKERLNYQFICRKILALPEHLSPQQLQMIVDGKLKDGDKVLIECEQSTVAAWAGPNMIRKHGSGIFGIKLNPHITIYPVEEKMYTREEVMKYIQMYELSRFDWRGNEVRGIEIADKWFEQNVK